MATEDIVRVLAEQSYSLHLIVKALRQVRSLGYDPIQRDWNDDEFEEFLKDFRTHHFSGTL